jgi:hypothetical protein
MFKKSSYVVVGATLLSLCASLTAFADTIDEQQKLVQSQLAVAKTSGDISSKQSSELDKGMREFSKLKRKLKEEHGDVLTGEDEAVLNKSLNDVTQKFTAMTRNKAPKDIRSNDAH